MSNGPGPVTPTMTTTVSVEVTPAETDRYRDSVRDELQKTARPVPSPILWHYTSGEGLIGIIESGVLWATHVGCVNDSTELRYSNTILLNVFKERQGRSMMSPITTPAPELLLFEKVISALSVDATPVSEWFIACLSEDGDDLAQWRAYGGGEGGYAIGFDVNFLHQALIQDGASWGPVCYNTDLQRQIAESVVDATVRFYLEGLSTRSDVSPDAWANAFLPVWRNHVAQIAPIAKHPAFQAEREWRIIRGFRGTADGERLKFQQRQSMLRRHLPLELRTHLTEDLLPICAVRGGPSRHKEISRVSVGDLLRSKRYPQQVYNNVLVSEVPFQAM